MSAYIVRRLIMVAINLVLVSMFVFAMLRVVPGDTTGAILGQFATPEQIQEFKAQHGLDKGPVEQYLEWASGILTGDFGNSLRTNFPVSKEFFDRFPVTMEIVLLSFTMTTTIGILGGILSASKQNSPIDYGFRVFAIFGLSIPSFLWLTLLLIMPARWFNYAPPFGATEFLKDPLANLQLFVPPAALLAVGGSAGLMRLTRSAFLEVFRQDYMRTARAKGLTERAVTFRHGFRNALPPVLTLAGLQLGNLLGGTIILESVMGLPGLGSWTLTGIQFKDTPIVMASVLYSATLLMFISLAVDLAYAVVDPRIRYS
ncbi:MAG: ABC transporter permease [Dehalococcoidia bacterium]